MLDLDHAVVALVQVLGQIVDLLLGQATERVDGQLEAAKSDLARVLGMAGTEHILDIPLRLPELLPDGREGTLGRLRVGLSDRLLLKELNELSLSDLRSSEFGSEELMHRLDFLLAHLEV